MPLSARKCLELLLSITFPSLPPLHFWALSHQVQDILLGLTSLFPPGLHDRFHVSLIPGGHGPSAVHLQCWRLVTF